MTVDHLGNKFKNEIDMCKHWNISYNTFRSRLYNGYDLKRALETPANYKRNSKRAIDHLGNEFNTIKEMCEYWGITYGNLNTRLRQGWSLKDALEQPIIKDLSKGTFIRDHLGNKFSSYTEMCEYWGVKYHVFKYRIKRWGLQKTLETPVREKNSSLVVKDHLGNRFKNKREMCKYWGISHETYYTRIRRGWTLKETLETKTNSKNK